MLAEGKIHPMWLSSDVQKRREAIYRRAKIGACKALGMAFKEYEEHPVIQIPKGAKIWDVVIIECANKHKVTVEDIKGPRRQKHIAMARQEAAYRLRFELKLTFHKIAEKLGYLDHSSIINAIKAYCERTGAEYIKEEDLRK